ncbi:MAG: GNAT family N-acetyltransferase [Oscillospiraceae bacterium]|nr:GNAT family N-acetyltransferase [Oscillospiraceae bacterium]
MEQEMTVNGISYRIIRLLGKGKGGYSYLVESDGKQFVVKQIHHEPCDYYSFGNKIEAELRDYERLRKAGIRIPQMCAADTGAERIVKEYIEGPTVMEMVQTGVPVEPYLAEVRDMAAKAMAAGLNIDYYPTNFVVHDGLLWYVDYECNDYMEQWDFEHWGIRYWQPKASFRSYRDEDYEAVCDFLIELNRKNKTHINWNWARFEWMMEHPEFNKSLRSSIGLWRSEDKVVGAAIYDMYYGEAFCGALPEHAELFPEILDYAYRELKDDSGLAVAIDTENTAEIRAAELAGFRRIDQKETIMELSLDRDFSSDLPGGLKLREMDQVADRDALEWLFWQGFDHGNDREEFERSLDHVPHIRKHFNRALSLSAVDPAGEPVSHCSLWFHQDTDYAYVEPVCTVPAYRGKGIASALLTEAFARAKALGAKKAYVISDLPFYKDLGFEITRSYTFFRKQGS